MKQKSKCLVCKKTALNTVYFEQARRFYSELNDIKQTLWYRIGNSLGF